MSHLKRTILTACVLTGTVHCNKSKNSKQPEPDYNSVITVTGGANTEEPKQTTASAVTGFIRAADLKNPGNLRPTSSADIVKSISDNVYFYRNSSQKIAASGCLATTLNAHAYSVTGEQYAARFFEPNLISCFQSDPAFAGLTITNATLNFWHVVICPETNIKAFNGVTVLQAQSMAKPAECVSELYNMTVVIAATTTKNGTKSIVTRTVNIARIGGDQVPVPAGLAAQPQAALALDSTGQTSTTPTSSPTDGALGCVQTYDEEKSTSDGCQFISSTVDNWVPAVYPDNQYTQIIDQALVASSPGSGPYYASGAMAFSVDGWNGTMTYTAPTDQPTWNARYGAGIVASGIFGSPVPKSTPAPATAATGGAKLTDASGYGGINFIGAAADAINKPFARHN